MKKTHLAIEILPRLLWIIEWTVLWFTYKQATESNPIGIIFIVLGIIFFLYTLRYIGKAMISKQLITTGPYQFSRHPMYLAIHLIMIGIMVILVQWQWLLVFILFLPLWYIDCRLEEKQMRELYPETYSQYMKRVRMFV